MANRLATALSPYLRAHADNPVDWYPWGEEAFAEAVRRDVPIMVSIGYATCHWCHVMARESFSDPGIAEVLDRGFVAVKVDREEHPEVDATYLAAASAFTGQLGWPLTVFTRPDGRAFYAGTYFPPTARQGIPSFREVLEAVAEAWSERRDDLDRTADAVGDAIGAASVAPTAGEVPGRAALDDAVRLLAADEDSLHGGFGTAPKFPVAPVLGFLAAAGPDGRDLATRTMRKVGASPLRDPVEGGFFRYATRADWSEPHYERMLTDNALLLEVVAELATGDDRPPFLDAIASGIVSFLTERMQLPEGGFAAAQDSESTIDGRRDEGGYYRRDATGRAELEPPALDAKLLTGWNGLAIGALSRAGSVFGDDRAITSARRAAERLLTGHVRPDGTLVRASLDGRASDAPATLEDAGMLAGGLVRLAAATGEVHYAVAARGLVDAAADAAAARQAESAQPGGRRSGSDEDGAGDRARPPFAAPGGGDPVLAARGLGFADDPAEGAVPSGLTACADAAWRLAALGAGERYRELAVEAARVVAGIAVTRPIAFGGALGVMARLAAPLVQLVVVVPDGAAARDGADDEDAAERAERLELIDVARRQETSVTAVVTESQAAAFVDAGFELFDGRIARSGRASAYRCRSFVCELPVSSAAELRRPTGR
ncbi:thioredoxin domain-containing protein [Agromyces sp. M3QZ16-3]|uniref:thioredoxin domain-containing protein n=1 Tax=Agromyces sp. M3QZ16-3 TaxID=3447585 RepID=UPI003F68FDF4